ncbi:hypothetical protein DRQ53_03195 [bacterium]|nr:MAG: hypothetical protein DRQ32_06755 [bacterium]RKZ17540.1 MAG: hypothetical protein DRQ53_03195 [bacterium]
MVRRRSLVTSGSSTCQATKDDPNASSSGSGATLISFEFGVFTEGLRFELSGFATMVAEEHGGSSAFVGLSGLDGGTSTGLFVNQDFTVSGTLEPGRYRLSIDSGCHASAA